MTDQVMDISGFSDGHILRIVSSGRYRGLDGRVVGILMDEIRRQWELVERYSSLVDKYGANLTDVGVLLRSVAEDMGVNHDDLEIVAVAKAIREAIPVEVSA